jgi:hypothetical protein
MYIACTNLQIGPSDGFPTRTFRAIVGDNAEVPDDIAALLVAQDSAVLVTETKKAVDQPAAKAPVQRRKRQK